MKNKRIALYQRPEADADFKEARKLARDNYMSFARYVWMALIAYNNHIKRKKNI